MENHEKVCRACHGRFVIDDREQAFLQLVSPQIAAKLQPLPLPDLCAACREQQRLSFRNEWNMYRRRCDASSADLISIYHPASPYKVYDPAIWWSDAYDPLQYGRDFDFSRTFFEQFHELNLVVPKAAIQNAKSENSAYTNYSAENKNCYLCVGTGQNEDCYYCARIFNCKFVCDSYDLLRCENCYECVHGVDLNRCVYSKNCLNSSDLKYCENCRGCRDCFGCADLVHKSFCLFNQELSEKDYRARLLSLQDRLGDETMLSRRQRSQRINYNVNCEDCSGGQLLNCSRCTSCFSVKESQDCRYVGSGTKNRDCSDCNFMDENELMYFATNLHGDYRVLFGALVWYSSETLYALNCFHCRELFGCSGMKHQHHCILNKQYDSQSYPQTVQRIIDHMRETGEWGRFFPASISPFPYNSSVAYEYYPLSEEEIARRGLTWLNPDAAMDKRAPGSVSEPAEYGTTVCAESGKPFRITKQERDLCARLGLPLPVKSPAVRRLDRMKEVQAALRWYV